MFNKAGVSIAPLWGMLFLTTSLCVGLVSRSATAEGPLDNLRKNHPRLYLDQSGFEALKERIGRDARLKRWYDLLQADALKIQDEPTVEYELIGPRLLAKSRLALTRVSLLAGLYRLDGDAKKAERARQEMLAAASFVDWNPKHFLDTAEMTHALAIGYDWLYDYLSPQDRETIRTAIIEKGLKAGLDYYDRQQGWPVRNNNWPQVCNGGLLIGALAIGDEEPEIAQRIVEETRLSIARPMRSYAPDGGWYEGPTYWNYGTRYNVNYLAALESALGTDFDLLESPGFSATGDFRILTIGPLGRSFNFADAGEHVSSAPQMFWLGRKFERPEYIEHEEAFAESKPEIFHLVWSATEAPKPAPSRIPLDKYYAAVNIAIFRSSLEDPNATYVGFKCGSNAVSHSHLDLGSFILDAKGVRWALDLGPDDYNLPAYFGAQRWNYFRLRTESHNTLTIDGANQSPSARAPIVAFQSKPERAFAVADLTDASAPAVSNLRRGIALLDRADVLVQDELDAPSDVEAVWNMYTKAKIELDGKRATLSDGGQTLYATILEPADARFEIGSADAPAPQRQQSDVRSLRIRWKAGNPPERLAVLLSPAADSGKSVELKSLDQWVQEGKLSTE
jgi:hypothetical protein